MLKAIAKTVSDAIRNTRGQRPQLQHIRFIKAGAKAPKQQTNSPGGLLATARDWDLQVDLGKQLKFPERIYATTLRPDMVLTSELTRQVVLVELTVPWEDRFEEANSRKWAKYEELAAECRKNGWKTRNEPVEVGCRGFVGRSLMRTLALLGIKGKHSRQAAKTIGEEAERASRWLWIQRNNFWS